MDKGPETHGPKVYFARIRLSHLSYSSYRMRPGLVLKNPHLKFLIGGFRLKKVAVPG